MSVKIFKDEHAVVEHAKDIARYGRKALIVTGRYSAKHNGALLDVQRAMDETGTKYEVFDKVEENPSVETVMEARDFGVSKGVDFVIGIGGGSPMDAAKAIAYMIYHSDESWEALYESGRDDYALPVVEIPTTCGTGSEVTGVAVITRHDLRTKKSSPRRIFPEVALLDPRYLIPAPAHILTNTAIDAMGHLIESYINVNANSESRGYVIEGLKLWAKGKEVILGKPAERLAFLRGVSETDVYMDMLEASMIAGKAIAITGTSLPHALSYRLTYEEHVPHGLAIGVFQSRFVKYADERTQRDLLRAMDFPDIESFEEFIQKTCRLDIDRIRYQIILENSIKDILAEPARIEKVPYRVDREILERIAGV